MAVELYTNKLIQENSPYLLQHAHNPVNWYPWGDEALKKANRENKLLIISIGYAACHWCHVMEQESFEDIEIAECMNDNFISIKIDREERPDIDQIYMNAVQLLTGRGGWPLNTIALPDGRPIYGGTYFPKQQWLSLLRQISQFVKDNPDKTEEQAHAITEGIKNSGIILPVKDEYEYSIDDLHKIYNTWINNIDRVNGGHKGAPKFPIPVGYQFLLHYAYLTNNKDAFDAVTTTLNKMADGGIYDQACGGFARYSTDDHWKVPHFEKMLYDNAQLVSLYSLAYQHTKMPRYKKVVYQSLEFIEREMTSKEGGFYSSLDADSEGEEGKFYVWTQDEIKNILNQKAPLIIDYYGITKEGNWEKGRNILFKTVADKEITEKYNITDYELEDQVNSANRLLLEERSKRIRPALDDKILTSWNALMSIGYTDAYRVFGEMKFLDCAIKNGYFILENIKSSDNRLDRSYKNGKSTINGFLDDYAFTIEALIALYQATFREIYLQEARYLLEYVIHHFYDPKSGMFFYTSDIDKLQIARIMEVADNVIPSSNSQMAKNLFILGQYFYNEEYIDQSYKMLNTVKENTITGETYYANWDILMAWFASKPYEVVISGEDYSMVQKAFNTHYLPDVFLSGGREEGNLPLHKGKFASVKTMIYVCQDKTCKMPVASVDEAIQQITGHSPELKSWC